MDGRPGAGGGEAAATDTAGTVVTARDPARPRPAPVRPVRGGIFVPGDLDGLPAAVATYFAHSIAPGTPITPAVRIRLHGRIRLGRVWLPFRAEEVLAPHRGFTWTARVAGVVHGSDTLWDSAARMRWVLGGVATLVDVDGPDMAVCGAGRCAVESIWAPVAVLPGPDAEWSVDAVGRVVGRIDVAGVPVEVRHEVDEWGYPRATSTLRWGDPEGTGAWGWHPFGGELYSLRTFGGLTVPAAGRMGWYPDTPGWVDGEVLRFRVTDLTPLSGPPGPS